ncbi:MAG TPA: Na+/H+ antiporter NhaA [Cyclobacteriaceae bacterium]
MAESKKVVIVGYRDLKHKISGESSQSLRTALSELGDSISFSYKYCPNLDEKPEALNAAKAIVAAENQASSEEMYQLLMRGDLSFTEEQVFEAAEKLDLDITTFKLDFNSKKTRNRIENDIKDSKKCGLIVFPGLTINGIPYNGAWDNYSLFSAIEKRGGKHIRMAIEHFFEWGAAAAVVLLITTLGALIMVNVGFHEVYEHWRHTKLGLVFSADSFVLPIEVWVNDFLMAIFFLLIGLEIKREVLDGELSDMKSAAMPVIGAIGGMLVPAMIYFVINRNAETMSGWGIPMATDIAFTLGLMALLGKKVPISLKIFISALAVADDLGAIIVIALFYGHGFHLIPFVGALVVIGVMIYLNKRKIFNTSVYMGLGLLLWFFVFESGLHATLAGVLTAILIPTRRSADLPLIAEQTAIIFDREIKKIKDSGNDQRHIGFGSLQLLRNSIERLREPSEYLQHSLERVVNFFILPLFAFFNTGILISGMQLNLLAPINMGIISGLAIGKPLGIVGACWLASRFNIAKLSPDINWSLLLGSACLAGVGFTMSIVVASSAFTGVVLTTSKISILIASALSAMIGLVILTQSTKNQN